MDEEENQELENQDQSPSSETKTTPVNADEDLVKQLQNDPEGIKKLLDAKRNYNSELKQHRKTAQEWKTQYESIKTSADKAKEDAENANLTELEKLRKEHSKVEGVSKDLGDKLTSAEKTIFNQKAEIAALRLGYTGESDYLEFKLNKHLTSLGDDVKDFGDKDLADWLATFREANTGHFGAQQSAKPGETRPTPPPSGARAKEKVSQDEVPDNVKNPRSFKDVQEAERLIHSIIYG